MRVLVTGATGNIGRHLVAQLHEAGHEVRALTRDPAKATFPPGVQAVAGDLTDTSTLHAAFDAIEAVHLITFGGDGYDDLSHGSQIIELAERHGVHRATVLGGWSATSVENALLASRIDWTILRPVEFMANVLDWAAEVRAHGTMSALGATPSAMVHEADIAGVAARALTEDGHGQRTYTLTGPEALTPWGCARHLAAATGEDITFVRLTEEGERARLAAHGYGDDYVEFGIQLALNPPVGAGVVRPDVETVTGRSARTFSQWAREHAERFRRAP